MKHSLLGRVTTQAVPIAIVALLAIAGGALATTNVAGDAAAKAKKVLGFRVSPKPRPHALVPTTSRGTLPAGVIPKNISVRNADRLGGFPIDQILTSCPNSAVDLGAFCLDSGTVAVPSDYAGQNDYYWAASWCSQVGGYLPTADQLIAAARRLKLKSVKTDDPNTASVDTSKDQSEMSGTLIATDPTNAGGYATPRPTGLSYLTVFDNGNAGGFAAPKPLGATAAFRCAYPEVNGERRGD